jgi:hypothetical protein
VSRAMRVVGQIELSIQGLLTFSDYRAVWLAGIRRMYARARSTLDVYA